MVKEKNLDAGKQADKLQDKFGNELMNDEELDQVAGGAGIIAKMANPSESDTVVGGSVPSIIGGHCKLFNSDQVVDSIANMLNTSESDTVVGGWKGFVTKENSTSDFRGDEFHCK